MYFPLAPARAAPQSVVILVTGDENGHLLPSAESEPPKGGAAETLGPWRAAARCARGPWAASAGAAARAITIRAPPSRAARLLTATGADPKGTRAASQSMWQEDAAADALLRVDLLEASSGTAARELVLELLGEFQSPEIKRVADPRAGELAFSGPGETAILFARANLVAMVRNAGRRVVQVTEFPEKGEAPVNLAL